MYYAYSSTVQVTEASDSPYSGMATTLQSGRSQAAIRSTTQRCHQLSVMHDQKTPDGATDAIRAGSGGNCADKENDQMREALQMQQEILDKLKHDSASISPAAQLQAEHWLNFQKLRQVSMSDPVSALANQQAAAAVAAAEMMRRESALMAAQSRPPKLDCFNPLAALNQSAGLTGEQRTASSHSQPSTSPSRSSQSQEEGDDAELKLEMMSPNVPTTGGQWTYEEQFKQLYELDSDPERKVFLDDLFAYSQRRGSPVNRIPIMAKQTLDMYKLFKLVVGKGGLVEVINKKLWREITKGLSLPSSITSAAFTLRTQYMKYLYNYECEKFAFSTASELQSAIDGNRREGRRPGYGYEITSPSIPAFYGQQGFPNCNPFFNSLMNNPMASLLSGQLHGAYMNGSPVPGAPVNHPRLTAPPVSSISTTEDRNQSPINVSSSHTPIPAYHQPHIRPRSLSPEDLQSHSDSIRSPKRAKFNHTSPTGTILSSSTQHSVLPPPDPADRLAKHHVMPTYPPLADSSPTSKDQQPSHIFLNSPQMHINSNDGNKMNGVESVTVSMEINGTMYEGTLYAKKID